jgi:hypothetical protein
MVLILTFFANRNNEVVVQPDRRLHEVAPGEPALLQSTYCNP